MIMTILNKKTALAASLAMLLSGCGGGEDGGSNEQPWLGGDSGGEEQENRPPVLSSFPSGVVEVMFSESIEVVFEITDPDGDDIQASLTSKPEWVSLSGDLRTININPELLDDPQEVSLQFTDGKSTPQTASFMVKINPPEYIEVNLGSPAGVSDGDTFTLRSVDNDGNEMEKVAVFNNGASFQFEYPVADTEWGSSAWVMEWDRGGEYAPFKKFLGDGEYWVSKLGRDLQFDPEEISEFYPTQESTALLHSLQKPMGQPGLVDLLDKRHLDDRLRKLSASTMSDLAAFYGEARNNGQMFPLNQVLTENLVEVFDAPILDPALLQSIDEMRQDEGVFVHEELWQRNLSERKSQLYQSVEGWKLKDGILSSPVSSEYAVHSQLQLSLNGDRYTADFSEIGLEQVGEKQGTWGKRDRGIEFIPDHVEVTSEAIEYPVDRDERNLRADLIHRFSMSFENATKLASLMVDDGKSSYSLLVSSPDGYRAQVIASHPANDSKWLEVGPRYSIKSNELDFESWGMGQPVSAHYGLNEERAIQISTDRHDWIFDMPSIDSSGDVSWSPAWVDLFDQIIVRERTISSPAVVTKVSDWTWSQINSNTFEFEKNASAGNIVFEVSVNDSALPETQTDGLVDSSMYSAIGKVYLNGSLVESKHLNLIGHPKALCESDSSCGVKGQISAGDAWAFSDFGRWIPEMDGLPGYAILNTGSTESPYIKAVIGTDCALGASECWVASGAPFDIEDGQDKAISIVDGESAHFIRMSNTRLFWLHESAGVETFELFNTDRGIKLWSYSRLNPANNLVTD
jgi:hypothetical protein